MNHVYNFSSFTTLFELITRTHCLDSLHQQCDLNMFCFQKNSHIYMLLCFLFSFNFSLEQGINDKILSFDYKEYKAEIETADAQNSYKDGVTVLVTGCLTSKDNLKRKFAQSFFLAPQENGFFVLNDVFRYVEAGELSKNHPFNGVNDATTVLLNQEPGKFFVVYFFFYSVFSVF